MTARLERIGQQIERANRIVNDLRAFVRPSSANPLGLIDPAEVVQSASNLVQHALRLKRVEVSVRLTPALPSVRGRQGALEQVLVNLINNAGDAGASAIEIMCDVLDDAAGRRVRLAVEDNGSGIPDHVLGKLFEQFVTTKPKGVGTGLGLRICRRIVEEMGGAITARNRAVGGARFEIILPAAEPDIAPPGSIG
jgi:C4-dicarboxylate-specific signal transduction histidine kinase